MKEIRTYSASLDNLDAIAADVEKFCAANGIDGGTCFDISLCIDEIFTNIVCYGYGGDKSRKIEIWLENKGGAAQITMRDSAPKFDPLTDAPEPDLCNGIEERNIGGLGVHFIKKKMDEVKYARRDNVNELVMSKRLKGVS